MKRVYFEDHGQDFLWWDVNEDGLVVDCGPFQASIWSGSLVVSKIEVGALISIKRTRQDAITIKYPIEQIIHGFADAPV